jgi:hypothetical protein
MSELQKQILALSPDQKLELISFIAAALKEDELFQKTLSRRDALRNGEVELLSLEALKARLYGKTV